MAKIDKKKKKLEDRIQELETEMVTSLARKSSDVREISVSEYTRRIEQLKLDLAKLKA